MNRKEFIHKSSVAAVVLGASSLPAELLANAGTEKLTILHTNDVIAA